MCILNAKLSKAAEGTTRRNNNPFFLSLKKMALTKSFKSLYVSHSRILCLLFRVDYVKTACNNLKLRNFIDS